jgi:purine-binding chemotaxis protein CheW
LDSAAAEAVAEAPSGEARVETLTKVAVPAPAAVPGEPPSGFDSLVFPAESEPESASSGKRIVLPASGLAEDILARAEAAGFDMTMPPKASVAPGPQDARAHSFSFFGAAGRDEKVEIEATEHLATFFLDREEYGVDVKFVQEIRRVGEITPVPRAPEVIRGVINLRGRILPVVDLKRKLGLGEVETTKASRVVVVRLRDRVMGLLVDGASQVLKVPTAAIEPPPDEVVEKGDESIRGVAKLEARLIILLDLGRVLAREMGEGGQPSEVTA